MNYFAHALPFLSDPYFAAGTGVPDWLTVVDRGVRVRARHVGPFLEHPEPCTASVARGILQHIHDDARFHGTRAFAELSMGLATMVRDTVGAEPGLRPAFLGHLLVEVLLDAALTAQAPDRLEAYYQTLESVDAPQIEQAVNRMANRPTGRLAAMISGFCRARILWDYLEDGKLLVRLNQVMRRVRLAELPDHFRDLLPRARRLVEGRKDELLEGIPTSTHRRMKCATE